MSKILVGCLLAILLVTGTAISQQRKHSVVPRNGMVPDEQTAIRIAEAVWIPIYGASQIESEKPFHAELRGGVWTVEGYLPEGMLGGVAVAEISQRDGRIIRVSHGK